VEGLGVNSGPRLHCALLRLSQANIHPVCQSVHVGLHVDCVMVTRSFADLQIVPEEFRPSQIQYAPESKRPLRAANQRHLPSIWFSMSLADR